MIGELDDIKICGMASAVPTYEDDNSKYETIIGKRQYRRQTRITGVSKRRISGRHQRSSDLCVGAAKPLLERLGWNSEEISVDCSDTASELCVPINCLFDSETVRAKKRLHCV